MTTLQVLRANALSEAMASPGISRHVAFKGEGYQIVRARSDPGVVSGWHHHGDYNVYGFVVSGTGRFERDLGEGDAITVGPGDFFHVPPHTVHREINPSQDQGNEFILFLCGAGPLVFNVEDSQRT